MINKDNAKKWVAKGELSELITFNDNFSIVKYVVERIIGVLGNKSDQSKDWSDV